MAFPDLIHTEIYQQALLTKDLMWDLPAKNQTQELRPRHNHDYWKLLSAAFKLDHIIRRALDPNRFPNWPPLERCSAIKTFIEVIDANLPTMRPDGLIRGSLEDRLVICREIIRRVNQQLIKEDRSQISSDGFRQEVLTCGLGLQIDDIVFENPIRDIRGINRYTGQRWTNAGNRTDGQIRLDLTLSHYWD